MDSGSPSTHVDDQDASDESPQSHPSIWTKRPAKNSFPIPNPPPPPPPHPPPLPPPSLLSRPNVTTLFKRAHSDYGTTSFSAVFAENRAAFGALFEVPAEERTNMSLLSATNPDQQMRYGIEMLGLFPTLQVCKRLMETLPTIHEPVLPPEVIIAAHERFRALYGKHFDGPRSCDEMSRVVLDLSQNIRTPMKSTMDETETLLDWLIGPQLRWEMLGLLFAFFGMAFISLQDWDPIFEQAELPEWQNLNRQSAAWKMKIAADGCLQFCWDADCLNEVVTLLMVCPAKIAPFLVSDMRISSQRGSARSTAGT